MFIVYHVFVNGVLSYIGEGKEGRESHATSGVSSVYELNKAHFNGSMVDVQIAYRYTTKQEAVEKERVEIRKHNPPFNKKHTVNDKRIVEAKRYREISTCVKSHLQKDANFVGSREKGEYWVNKVSEMFGLFGVKPFTEGLGVACMELYDMGVPKSLAFGEGKFITKYFKVTKHKKRLYLSITEEIINEIV